MTDKITTVLKGGDTLNVEKTLIKLNPYKFGYFIIILGRSDFFKHASNEFFISLHFSTS